MKYRVTLHPLAKLDLRGIYEFIAADNPLAAVSYVRRIRILCSKLADVPMRGKSCEGLSPNLRMISFEGRVALFYRIADTRVRVLRILYGGRDYPRSWPDA
jgi:toxin ParE1/3/4